MSYDLSYAMRHNSTRRQQWIAYLRSLKKTPNDAPEAISLAYGKDSNALHQKRRREQENEVRPQGPRDEEFCVERDLGWCEG